MPDRAESQLLGPWMTSALVVGGMIGAGIFMLPVSLAPYGPNAIIGWIISSIGVLSLAYSLARLARRDGLGIQAYIERELGPTIGFIVTWAFWVSVWTSNAALAIAAASGLARIVPSLADPTSIAWVSIGLIGFLAIVNALGARATGRMAVLTVAIKIMPLLAVVLILGATTAAGGEVEPLAEMPLSFSNLAGATALTLFALLGFETATAPVDKVRDPGRNIPLAMLAGTAFVAILYLLCSTAVLLILPAETVAGSVAPFADAIGSAWGEQAAILTAFAMAVSAFGCLNGGVMIGGELSYSMSLRGDLPALLAKTDKAGTPILGQVVAAALAIILVLSNMSRGTAGLFTFIVLLTTSATLWLYLAGAVAALKQRPGRGATFVIIVGIAFTAFAFYGVGWEGNAWGLVLLAAGLAIRTVMRRFNSAATSPVAAHAPAAPRE